MCYTLDPMTYNDLATTQAQLGAWSCQLVNRPTEPCTSSRPLQTRGEGPSPESSHVREVGPVKLSLESLTMTRTRPWAGCPASGR